MRLRPKTVAGRASAVIVAGVLVAAGLLRGGGTSPEPTVYHFLLDWEQGNYQQAAALTTGRPDTVAAELADAYDQLNAASLLLSMQSISQHGDSATASFSAAVELGGSSLEWRYSNSFRLRASGSGWRIIWSPSVIAPGLGPGDRLAIVQEPARRAQLLTASGQPLAVSELTYEIGVNPKRLSPGQAVRIADRLAEVFGLQAGQVAGEINTLPSGFHELITLTPSQYGSLHTNLAAIPGLQVRPVRQRLFDSIAPDVTGAVGTEVAPILREEGVPYRPGTTVGESGLQQVYQRQLAGTPTTGIVIENARGTAVRYLQGAIWDGSPGKPVRTTLDGTIQRAADQALGGLGGSAALVAVQASTGQILAVASRQAGGMPALDPLSGRYQPGQAFTIVSAAALLATGKVSPSSRVQCSRTSQVDGHNFVNVPPEPARLGASPTFSTDFAVGCSTAFTVLSMVPSFQPKLATVAAEFGIGSNWQLPVGGQFSGTIGDGTRESQVAAAAIGQGGVRVSPLDMALAAAAADTGRWHAPSLLAGADPAAATGAVTSPQVLSQLQGLMRGVVTHGAGSAANVGQDVYGQVGNAAFGARGSLRINWFVGFQGNVAFAVAELGKSSAPDAASLAGIFLRKMHTGS